MRAKPNDYRVLHHITPNCDMHSPCHVIAAVRVEAIRKWLAEEFGEKWWKKREAGAFVRKLAQTRGESDIKAWQLSPEDFVNSAKEASFL